MVSVLAFYSDNPSSKPAEVYSFSVRYVFVKNKKINIKRPGWPSFFKKEQFGRKPWSSGYGRSLVL